MGKDGCAKETLNHTECTKAEVLPEDREESVKERGGPPDFGHDEDDGLEDDEESVEDSPKCSCSLIGNSTSSAGITLIERESLRDEVQDVLDVITVKLGTIDATSRRVGAPCFHEDIDGFDVGDHSNNAAREE